MVDFDRRYSHAVLFISYACADVMRADKSALCRRLIVRYSETNIELECLPKMADHVLGPWRSPNLQWSVPSANKPASQPSIRKSDDVIGRAKAYEAIVKGENMRKPNIPESFNVLVHELRGLALEITMD